MLNTFNTIFEESKRLAEGVYLFRFKLIDPKELLFSAGQYMIMEIPQPDKTVKKRFISIASPQQDSLEFEGVMKIIPGGVASTFLLGLKEGDQVHFQGPAGVFTLQNNNHRNIFIATGTGIGPIRSMITSNILPVTNHSLFWGLKTLNDLYFFEELKDIAQKNPQFSLKICLSKENALDAVIEENRKYFVLGRVTKELDNLTTNYKLLTTNFEFYLCGAKEVVDSLRQYLLEKGVNPENIHTERFI